MHTIISLAGGQLIPWRLIQAWSSTHFPPSSGSPADLVHTCMAVAFELVEVHDEVQVREEGKQGVIPWLLGNFNFNPASPPIRT